MTYGQHPLVPSSLLGSPMPDTRVQTTNDFIAETYGLVNSARDDLQRAQENQARQANRTRMVKQFKIGDLVLISTDHLLPTSEQARRSRKLRQRFTGPYRVTQVIPPVNYKLDLPGTSRAHSTFHISALEPFHDHDSDFPDRVQTLPTQSEE